MPTPHSAHRSYALRNVVKSQTQEEENESEMEESKKNLGI